MRIEQLAGYIGTDQILRVGRQPVDPHELIGFALGVSAKFLLLQLVDGSTLQLNGYSALRTADIRYCRVDETFIPRAMRLLERRPIVPEYVDLTSWQTLLRSVQARYPLLKIETEKKKAGVCFIGRVANLTAQQMDLIEVNTEGIWAETETFALKDITRIEFDDEYVDALARLVEHEAATKQRSG